MVKKMTNEEFIKKAKSLYGDKYDYSKVDVNKRDEKGRVCIICPKHGEFWQKPSQHLSGHQCSKCKHEEHIIGSKVFIERANKIFNGFYDYQKVIYKGIFQKVTVTCPKHGDFEITPSNHLQGSGCKECMKERFSKGREKFTQEAQKVHGSKYDYSKVVYKNERTKVKIICPVHGEFFQTPMKHLMGQGCPVCNESKMEKEIKFLLQERKISFTEQKKFEWLGQKSLDFYLPQYNIGIECQGEQHFKAMGFCHGKKRLTRQLKNDEIKFRLCEIHGIKILYYSNYYKLPSDYFGNIYTDKEMLIKRIIS